MTTVLATYENRDKTIIIKVMDDTTYHISRDGKPVQRFDMTKWYYNGYGVMRHIENDIKAGYYPGVSKVS